jgi:hypothetical protein
MGARMTRPLQPAARVIRRLGGEQQVATIAGIAITGPYRWQQAKARGGTGGLIPQRHHRVLLNYARDHKIKITARDFIGGDDNDAH